MASAMVNKANKAKPAAAKAAKVYLRELFRGWDSDAPKALEHRVLEARQFAKTHLLSSRELAAYNAMTRKFQRLSKEAHVA
jgi:hypothetical protein